MELATKKGFKQTEVGLIPEDWNVKKFKEFGRFFKGKGIKKNEVMFEGNPCVRYGELYTRYDNVIKETFSFINNEVAEQSVKLKKGDLLFAGSGETKADIGKSAVILRDDTYAGGDIVVFRVKDIDPIFLGFMSNSIPVSKQKSTNGQGDAVVHIYSGGISKIRIPLPPTLKEQQAIATALSDVDALISSLDTLITKKKAIKQGAMQQLLTPPHKGGKRLPGFSGEWVEKTLGQTIVNGQLPSGLYKDKALYGTGCKIIKLGDVFKNDYFKHNLAQRVQVSIEEISSYEVRLGDLIIALASVKLEGVGKTMLVNELNEPTIYDHNVALIRLDEKFDSHFFSHLFKSKQFREQVSSMATQVGTTFLKASSLKSFELSIPNTLLEQEEIANVLNDMDLELEQLQSKKAKYQQIKQGMMQELLMGKTRLV